MLILKPSIYLKMPDLNEIFKVKYNSKDYHKITVIKKCRGYYHGIHQQ